MKIYGIITDASEEKPLAKSKVVLYIGDIELVTFYSDKDGKFQVEQNLDQHIGETLICHVEKDNFNPREVTYKIGDEDIRLDIELVPIEREKPVELPKEKIAPPSPPPPSPSPPPPPPSNTKWLKIAIAVGALIAAGIVVYFLIPGKRVIEKPEIISFDANPSQIMKGKSSTLSWQTSKAEEVEISDIGKISLSGSRKVSPRETTTYTLMARNKEGKEVGRKVKVKVKVKVSREVREVPLVAPLPDLYISEFSLSPSTPTQGSHVKVRVGVYNRGSAKAKPFTVEWWAGENFPKPAKVWQVDGLAAKGGRILTYTYDGYRSWYGKLTTKAVADSKGKVKEQNKKDNVRRIEIKVRKKESPTVAALPDLYISEFSLSPSTPTQGSPVKVRVGVYNRGSAKAKPFTVEWWAGENFPEPAKVWQVNGSAAKGGRILTYTYDGYRSWYGKLTTKAVADSKGKVKEQNEKDNVRKMEIRVRKK